MLKQDNFRTVQLNVNTLLRMHLSHEENYSMFPRQTSELSCKGCVCITSCKGMEDSECFLPCLHLKLQPVHEHQCYVMEMFSSSKRYPGLPGTNYLEFAGIEKQSA